MQTTPLLQSERVEKEKMNKYNIRFNLEEDTNKLNINISKNRKYNPVTHRHEYTGKPKYISSMSGGLEYKLYNILAKVYVKIINKLSKYKKNIFE
jgi:hypothetical protein|tara:strand:- start:342 stop:626 length:285 start_codon:yes stop_codon:yes gene_type:complete